MAESTDKKTRRIAEKRVESGKEFESYQEAQNQLLAIQAEQQQNLALQANNAMNMQAQRQTLGQAAEIMAMDGLNSTTRNVLGGYGLSQPRVIKETKVVKQGPQNITINNNTTNIQGGPVQGRDVSIRPKEDTQGKFKAWLTNVFARQDAQFQKQNLEYQRRESSLTRNANKMMRKLEGLGKDITTAMDPRKMAQRMSNPFMNMLKTIGLIGLATRLPKILGAINRVETTVRGWVSKLGELFGGDGKLNLDLDDKSTFLGKLRYALWNEDETGALNKLLENISQTFYDRKALADKLIGSPEWKELKPGESIKHLLDWLGAFFGGAKGVIKTQNIQKEYNILDKNASFNENVNRELSNSEKRNVFLSGNNYIKASNLKETTSKISEEELRLKYIRWAEEQHLDVNNAGNKETYLKEHGREFLIDLGESDILTLKVHDGVRNGGLSEERPLTLNRKDLSWDGHRLARDNRRATLACSLDLYWCLKGKFNYKSYHESKGGAMNPIYVDASSTNAIDMELFLLLLKLLSTANDILVFKKFSDLFKITGETVKIKLVEHDMEERDRQFYLNPYTEKYEKIVLKEVAGDPLDLLVTDFGGRKPPQKEWGVIRLSSEQLQEILQKVVGSNKIKDYTTATQLKALNNLQQLGIISNSEEKFDSGNISGRVRATSQRIMRTMDREYNSSISYANEVLEERRALMASSAGVGATGGYNSKAKYGIGSMSWITKDSSGNKTTFNLSAEEKKQNMDKIRDALKKEGFSDAQIAGIMGVMSVESAGTFDPRVVEKLGNGDLGPGEGIVQWTSKKRKQKFKTWWENEHKGETFPGIPYTTLNDQIGFFLEEFKSWPVYKDIKNLSNSNLSEAEILERTVDLFTRGFENGCGKYADPNVAWAHYDENGRLIPGTDYKKNTYQETYNKRLGSASGIMNSYLNHPVESHASTIEGNKNNTTPTIIQPGSYSVNNINTPSYSYSGSEFTSTASDVAKGMKERQAIYNEDKKANDEVLKANMAGWAFQAQTSENTRVMYESQGIEINYLQSIDRKLDQLVKPPTITPPAINTSSGQPNK